MGQKHSGYGMKLSGVKLPILWVLRSQKITENSNPQEPIKFQYKTRKKTINLTCKNEMDKKNYDLREQKSNASLEMSSKNNHHRFNKDNKLNNKRNNEPKTSNIRRFPARTRSEPSLFTEKRERRLYKIKQTKPLNNEVFISQDFGYEIDDVNKFLTNATIENPANIPVVLTTECILYQTRIGGFQAEIQLPLGMVVNAIFKNENWLYVQTPHAVEGYINFSSCLPLGIIPPEDNSSLPLWENVTDVFPKPCGNSLYAETEIYRGRSESRSVYSACSEINFDKLYLQATNTRSSYRKEHCQSVIQRHTLLIITMDYTSDDFDTVSVQKGDVVSLLRRPFKSWLWVRTKEGNEGFIPSNIAEYQFL